ncbi:mercury transport protein [Xanthobacter autotrophicus]|jgi:mercuric ion transport protein|uniref:Mercury transport protein n=1 Tax=Xanthobacter dioxanivorans TaxID=2528964 RepID=A0A974PUJ3_9HYPH|nr:MULTISPECIES: mercury transport protein [Xanthobacter]QRG10019.1 mercury transport protein [Xanthobacter dioxanivorans]UDQ88479.1 mercury transport protein [Xanthobacter autotrophicus]
MTDPALFRVGTIGAVLAAICCVAPLVAVSLPLAGLGAWMAGAGLVVLPLMVAGVGLVAWGLHHRRERATGCNTKIRTEGMKP